MAILIRDLFDAEDEGYFADGPLLEPACRRKTRSPDCKHPVRRLENGWRLPPIPTVPGRLGSPRARKVEVALGKKTKSVSANSPPAYDTLVAELEDNDAETSEEFERVSQELSQPSGQTRITAGPDSEIAPRGRPDQPRS